MVFACQSWYRSCSKGAPPLSSLEKEKDIDFDLLQDLMDVDIDPLDIDLEKDPLAAKVFKVGLIMMLCHCCVFFSYYVFFYITICFYQEHYDKCKSCIIVVWVESLISSHQINNPSFSRLEFMQWMRWILMDASILWQSCLISAY